MKKHILTFIASSLLVLGSTHLPPAQAKGSDDNSAGASLMTGSHAYEMCTDGIFGAAACHAFLEGFISGVTIQSHLTGTDPFVCTGGMSLGEVRQIFVGHLVRHKQSLDEPAFGLLIDSLEGVPCP